MLILPLTEEQARKILLKVNESNLAGDKGIGFVEYHITRMYNEFGGNWDEHKATEYINAVVAENGLGNVSIKIEYPNKNS